MTISSLFSRPFSFKKKTASGVNKVEVPAKVITPDVLADRNVNVPKNNVVTKSPLTFSNKLDRPQTNKINTFFSVSSKGRSDGVSQKEKCAPARQNPFAVSATKSSAAPSKCASKQSAGSSESAPSNLDTSLGFPADDWDDLDDFETPVKSRNNSFNSKKSDKSANSVAASSEEQTGFVDKLNSAPSLTTPEPNRSDSNQDVVQTSVDTEKPEPVDNIAAVSPGPNEPDENPVENQCDDSPVRRSRRRPPSHLSKLSHFKSVLSDSEEDNDVEPECLKETIGSNRTIDIFPTYRKCFILKCLALVNHCFNLSLF